MFHPSAPVLRHRLAWMFGVWLLAFCGTYGTALLAQEVLSPDSPSVTRAATDDSSPPLTLRMQDAGLDALRGETLVWHRSFYGTNAVASGPIQVGDGVYYALGEHLFLLDVFTGHVRGRQGLAGQVRSLSLEGDHGALVLTGGSDETAWTDTCTLYAFGTDCRIFQPTNNKSLHQARNEATHVIVQAVQEGDPSFKSGGTHGRKLLKDPTVKARLASLLPALEEAEQKDLFNPWFTLVQAEALTELGQPQRAAVVLERLFASRIELEGASPHAPGSPEALRQKNAHVYALELLLMSTRLDALDPQLAERAFEVGMASRLRQGYEPELALGIMQTLLILGNPQKMLQEEAGQDGTQTSMPLLPSAIHLDKNGLLERRARRVWDLSPLAEGAAGLYQALAEAAEARGDSEFAALWFERARLATPMLTTDGLTLRRAALALELFQACLLALALGFVVRWISRSGKGPAPWLRLRRWSRSELMGMLLLQGLLLGSSVVASRAIVALAESFKAPSVLGMGSLAHPEVLAWAARGPQTPANTFLNALSLQQAGKLEEASTLYASLSLVEASINRGLCLIALGQRNEGQALLTQALEQRPGDEAAAYALGQDPPGPRVERLKRLGVSRPLLALPSPELWSQLWQERAEVEGMASGAFVPVVGLLRHLSLQSYSGMVPLGALLALILAGLGLMALFRPEAKVEAEGPGARLGQLLGVLLPGTGPEWRMVGPLLTTMLILLGLLHVTLSRSGGKVATLLESIVQPDFGALYGVSAPIRTGVLGTLESLAPSWWAFWLGAVAVSAVLSWAQDTQKRSARE